MISRICDEFHCLPTRALWELEHDPDQMVLQVMDVRAYERMTAAVDRAKNESDLPESALANEVIEHRLAIRHAVFLEKLAAQKARAKQKG